MKTQIKNWWTLRIPCSTRLWTSGTSQKASVSSYKPRGEVLPPKRINRLTKNKLTK